MANGSPILECNRRSIHEAYFIGNMVFYSLGLMLVSEDEGDEVYAVFPSRDEA